MTTEAERLASEMQQYGVTTMNRWATGGATMIRQQAAEIERKDALLRRALEALDFYLHESCIKERNDPHYTNEDRSAWDAAAAIKQHFGEQP